MKRVTTNMHTQHSANLLPGTHCFYIPIQISALDSDTADWQANRQHSSSLLIMITAGSGSIEIGGAWSSLSCGSTVWCNSSAFTALGQGDNLQGVKIEYTSVSANGYNASYLTNDTGTVNAANPKAAALAARLLTAWNTPPEEQPPLNVQLLFTELLTELYATSSEVAEPQQHWLDRTLRYVESRYNEDITRTQAAELAGVTPEHFSRVFRKSTGRTFNEHVNLLRIRKAQQRILTGAPNLSTLAMEVGYSEGTYLSRKFKQVVGVSPAAYHRKNKAIVSLNFNHTASLQALEVLPRLGVFSDWIEKVSLSPIPPAHNLKQEGAGVSGFYERLTSARPDVILSYALPEVNKQLLSVAPVIELPFMQMDWKTQFRLIAEVTGRKLQAEIWLSRYAERCRQANEQLDRRLGRRGTAMVWELGRDAAYCFSSSYGHGAQILYDDLGFSPPDRLVTEGLAGKGYLEVALPDVAGYIADHIFITCSAETAQSRAPLRSILQPPEQQRFAASAAPRVYFLNQPAMFYGFDPLSSQAQLKVLLQALTS
ncbi:AraC family transcriptional regulator [Paenibacillus sp. MMS20-IR301]|uniref:AraC family transcriptional regulator n=1 Tax=Paenibacillus sp. MMS20-IR301 TaxID=2895946 RepID=UPI0028E2F03C|nr:AraC family transcriptional regulator [Paenibacillus sp. MMS20-IR301]WNS44420.1 AraC family transcriptional regulator [Paenibacillus sp. MMS20-IR301]